VGLGSGPVDLVGLSFGGMVAQHLTLDHPELVRTLTLLDTSPAFGLDGVTTPESWLDSRVRAIRDPEPSAPGVEAVVAGLVGRQASPEVRSTMVESMRAVPAATLEAACRALVRHDTRDRLDEITAPVLVMVGAEDTETPPSYAEAIARPIPGAELMVVPGAGHLLNLEDPDTVNDRLRAHWLESREDR
jgi:pimeloyl-ACP methyl ester carboxylesterase